MRETNALTLRSAETLTSSRSITFVALIPSQQMSMHYFSMTQCIGSLSMEAEIFELLTDRDAASAAEGQGSPDTDASC
jgi:hypothetical protein